MVRVGWQRDSSAPLRCARNDMWEGRDGFPHARGQRVGLGVRMGLHPHPNLPPSRGEGRGRDGSPHARGQWEGVGDGMGLHPHPNLPPSRGKGGGGMGVTWGGDDIGLERAVRELPLRGASARGRAGWQRDSSTPLRCVQNDMWEGRDGSPACARTTGGGGRPPLRRGRMGVTWGWGMTSEWNGRFANRPFEGASARVREGWVPAFARTTGGGILHHNLYPEQGMSPRRDGGRKNAPQ